MISQAFVLGAGLGTRLRPLTNLLPKPMIPVWNKPLITYAFDHLIADAGVDSFLVNTHHRPEAYEAAFPDGCYRGCPLDFRHEPTRLETAGGIANIIDWLPRDESFIVYNGDILTDLPLGPAIEAHENSDHLVTMILRTSEQAPHVHWDADTGKVVDIRNLLETGTPLPAFLFTGIYLVRPAFLDFLTPGKVESVIWPFLKVIQEKNGIGGVVIDEGTWSDLGTCESYLAASAGFDPAFPRYGATPDQVRIHPEAKIDPAAVVCENSAIGSGCEIGPEARVERSILWPGCRVPAGAEVTEQIVCGEESVTASLAETAGA